IVLVEHGPHAPRMPVSIARVSVKGTQMTLPLRETTPFSRDVLALDAGAEAERIASVIREQILTVLRRRGAVVGLSGGVDSSVVAALAVRALGPDRVIALFMPERDSSPESLRLGQEVARTLGIEGVIEDLTPALVAAGCYERQQA